jgi:phosphoglycolate phosphatase-like HAD superfamily hydrolase
MSPAKHTRRQLLDFKPKHETFVGIDSDGCVFDTMEIKQKKCFHPLIISHWRLEPIAQYVRESAEFVNLYSTGRGRNRFPCLIDTIELLRDRPEVLKSGVKLPVFTSLKKWIASGESLGNPNLEQLVSRTGDEELCSILEWSRKINKAVETTAGNIRPFKWALKSLPVIAGKSDAICVSQTPSEALEREWTESGILDYVSIIAGQELGTKTEHIALATKGKYPGSKILMIGDAPGDRQAADANSALFYPINPGREEESWERFFKETYKRFLNGTYGGSYQARLVAEFEALLPSTPPWKRKRH